MIKYAVLNPMNGEYTKVCSKEEANNLLVQNVLEFYKLHSHIYAVTEIQVDESGNETWVIPNNGTELPEEYLEKIKLGINA